MSDDDGEQSSFGFQFFPISSVSREEMEREMDKAQMEQMAARHDVQRFIYNMSGENLNTLRTIIAACKGDAAFGSYVEGQITAVLMVRHNICSACGLDHDKELLDNLDANTEQHIIVTDEEVEFRTNCTLYGVREPSEPDFQRGLLVGMGERPVLCENCGALYQSLQDRMMRTPGVDGCSGCQLKSAHG